MARYSGLVIVTMLNSDIVLACEVFHGIACWSAGHVAMVSKERSVPTCPASIFLECQVGFLGGHNDEHDHLQVHDGDADHDHDDH